MAKVVPIEEPKSVNDSISEYYKKIGSAVHTSLFIDPKDLPDLVRKEAIYSSRVSRIFTYVSISVLVAFVTAMTYFLITQWDKLNELYDSIFIILDYLPVITNILDKIECFQQASGGQNLSSKCTLINTITQNVDQLKDLQEVCASGDLTCVNANDNGGQGSVCCASRSEFPRLSSKYDLCVAGSGETSMVSCS